MEQHNNITPLGMKQSGSPYVASLTTSFGWRRGLPWHWRTTCHTSPRGGPDCEAGAHQLMSWPADSSMSEEEEEQEEEEEWEEADPELPSSDVELKQVEEEGELEPSR